MTDARGKGADCIRRGVAAGLIDAERGGKAIRQIEQIEADYMDALGPVGARRQANIDFLEQQSFEQAMRKRAALMQLAAQERFAATLDRAQAGKGLDTQVKLLRGLVDSTGMTELGYRGAVQEARRVRSTAHALMADTMAKFRTLPGGLSRNKAAMVNVLREIFGEGTGDAAARQMARSWEAAAELLRQQFNALGGAIAKLDRWHLPQNHNVLKVRKATFPEWSDVARPLLDRAAMRDRATGKPLTDAQLDVVLRDVYDTVRSKGWDQREPSGAVKGRSMVSRHMDSRVMMFKDAQSWLAYHEKFGDGDAYASMMGHIDLMSREIGAMRAMGPNPRATIRYMGDRVQKAASLAGDAKAENAAKAASAKLDTLFSHFIGDANDPVNGTIGRVFSSTRQFLTAAQLGGAVLSALTDVGFQRVTARFNGLPHWKIMRRQLSLLNPANAEDRKLAVRLGLIAEEWSTIAASQMRYTGEVVSGSWSRSLADGVLRVSGLSAWTQAGRWAFGMEFMAHLADHSGKSFEALPDVMRRALTRYAISPDDWNIIRATPHYKADAGGFLRPDDIVSRGDLDPQAADDLATKLLDMIHSETEFAVPSTSVVGKAAIISDARPGTFAGEFLRSTLMYKNFAVTLMHTHLMRGATQAGAWNKFKYFSSLMVHTTLMGALVIQLKDIARGKDPRPMADDDVGVSPKFLTAAMMQGGGLGLFGDFLFSGSDRFGHSKAVAAAGPMAGFLSDTFDLLAGNATDAMKGEKTNFGRDAVKYAGRYTPGASLWYLRYMIERGLLDTVQGMVDDGAEKSFAARRQSWGREQAADYFSPPGSGVVPQRGPDWANALRTFEQGKVVAAGRRRDVAIDGQSYADIAEATKLADNAARRGLSVKNASRTDLEQAIARDKKAKAARKSRKKPAKQVPPGALIVPP